MNSVIFEDFIKTLKENIHKNYMHVADAFENEYRWSEVDPVRTEVCKCIICGFHQAAITLTNHLLESALKKALIIDGSAKNKTEQSNIINVSNDATVKYANKDLNFTINQACQKGLIAKDEKKLLHKFREQYRNAFSHAAPQKTFGDMTLPAKMVTTKDCDNPDDFFAKIFTEKPNISIPVANNVMLQGIVQSINAEQQAVYYFLAVDRIIRNLCQRLFNGSEQDS